MIHQTAAGFNALHKHIGVSSAGNVHGAESVRVVHHDGPSAPGRGGRREPRARHYHQERSVRISTR